MQCFSIDGNIGFQVRPRLRVVKDLLIVKAVDHFSLLSPTLSWLSFTSLLSKKGRNEDQEKKEAYTSFSGKCSFEKVHYHYTLEFTTEAPFLCQAPGLNLQ